ncbi:MAG: hypothetical protein PHC41_07745 [Lachnospiraceae bacterium]|nr:hypothetical protein [Lachnospiraceae bacterium]MDD3616107.1 hypothetical protein [Lachnospiraceae bacterium]
MEGIGVYIIKAPVLIRTLRGDVMSAGAFMINILQILENAL